MDLAILGILVTVALGAVAIWQAWPGQRLARRELHKTQRLRISVNGSGAIHHVWVLPWQDDSAVMIDFQILLTNVGDKSIDGVTVTLRVPSGLYAPEIARELRGSARLTGADCAVDPSDGAEHSVVTFRIDCINPGMPVLLNDFLILTRATCYSRTLEHKVADGDARIRYRVAGAWGVSLSVSARDMQAAYRDLRLWSLQPGDPFLRDTVDREGDHSLLGSNPSAAAERSEPAVVVKAGKLKEFPVGLPDGRKIMRTQLADASPEKRIYFPDIGFLPLDQSS